MWNIAKDYVRGLDDPWKFLEDLKLCGRWEKDDEGMLGIPYSSLDDAFGNLRGMVRASSYKGEYTWDAVVHLPDVDEDDDPPEQSFPYTDVGAEDARKWVERILADHGYLFRQEEPEVKDD